MPGIQHRHLRPLVTGGLASEQPFRDGMALGVVTHALAHHRLHPLAAAVFRHQDRVLVAGANARQAMLLGLFVGDQRLDLTPKNGAVAACSSFDEPNQ